MRARFFVPLATVALLGALPTIVPAPARACVHATRIAAKPVTQKGQHLLVVHDGKAQTTVLQVDYASGEALTDVAMVLPVPSVPSRYETGDAKLFAALDSWSPLAREQPQPRAKSKNGAHAAAVAQDEPLELLEPVKTGPYEIQPMKAKGAEGAAAVGKWLTDNGYNPIPADALGYYVSQEWAFLAVKTNAGKAGLGTSGALPPLSYTFETDRVVVPLKLEAQGVLPVRIYMVSTRAHKDEDFADANAKGFEVAGSKGLPHLRGAGGPSLALNTKVGAFAIGTAPAELASVFKGAGITAPELHLRVLFSERFGEGAADPKKWAEELAVPKLVSAAGAVAPAKAVEPDAPQPDAKSDAKPDGKSDTKADAKLDAKLDAKPAKADAKAGDKPAKKEKPGAKSGSCSVGDHTQPAPLGLLLLLTIAALRRRH
ncbi:MAG: DUF2330 domain-containing protein [Myxococcota bacterium]